MSSFLLAFVTVYLKNTIKNIIEKQTQLLVLLTYIQQDLNKLLMEITKRNQ